MEKSMSAKKFNKLDPEIQQLLVDSDRWKHKYEVLQGKYNAEVPRYALQVKALENQVGKLMELLETPESTAVLKAMLAGKEQAEEKPDDGEIDVSINIGTIKRMRFVAPGVHSIIVTTPEIIKALGQSKFMGL